MPGETYELGVTVTNKSQEVERFELSISELDPSWYQFDWADMLLYPTAPGNEATSYVRITIPPDVRPGTYAPAVMVIDSQSAVMQQPFLLTINQVAGAEPELSLNPPTLQTIERAGRFQIGLKNPLGQPLTLKLTVRSARPDAQIRIHPPLIEVPAFSETTSRLEIQPLHRNWYKSDQLYNFSVVAEGLNREVSGSLLQLCALPWLRQLLTTPALLVASLLAPLLLVGLLTLLLWPHPTTAQPNLQAANCVEPSHILAATLLGKGTTTDIIISERDGSRPRRVGGESSDRLPAMFASLLSLSPDDSNLVYVTANNEQMDNATIYLLNLGSSNRQPVITIPSGFWPSHPVWSQDGSQLAYVVRTNDQLELWTVNLNSADKKATKIGAPRQLDASLFYNDPGETGPVCWSTDSTRLLIRPASASRQTEVNVSTGLVTPDVIKPAALPLHQTSPVSAQVREPQLAPIGSGFCFVPTFSQNDTRWQNMVLKPQGQKMGDRGCPIATSAMLLNYYKVNTDPAQLNNCLDTEADPPEGVDWSLPPRRCSSDLVQGGNRIDFSWDTLNATLKSGLPVIVGLLGGQNSSHYVVVVGGSDNIASTYRVNDPWDGTNYKSLGYFLEKGYQLQWLIIYTSNSPTAPVCPDRTNPGEKFQLGFALLAPVDGGVYSNTVQVQYQPDSGIAVTGTLLGTILNYQAAAATGTGTTVVAVPATGQISQPVTNGMFVSAEGSYSLVLQSAGSGVSPARLISRFVVDLTPPVVDFPKQAAIFDPTPRNGYLIARRAVALELKATDNLSGIARIEYRVNGPEWLPYNFEFGGSPVIFDKPGQYNVFYRAMDAAGNYSAEKSLQFEVDLTPPGTPSGIATTPTGFEPTTTPTVAVATTAVAETPTTIPPVPTLVPVPGLLTSSPASLSFDANTLETNLQLVNSGGSPVNWLIQPLSGPALNYLQFSQTSGVIPPGGNQFLTVNLATANQTTGPVTANFSIVYNNNTALLPITVQISPQPTPRVQFISPSSGAITNRQVPIKLDIATSGVGKPNHATVSAKFIDQVGGSISERQLPGIAVPPDWTLSWDTGQLPPQSSIDLSASICWSSDESACVKNAASLTGLSIPKPSVVVILNPNSDKLGASLALSSQVSNGTIDHVSYTLTFKDANGAINPLTQRGSAPDFGTTFDTSVIPPQTSITLNALACWGQDDNPNTCVAPTNPLPASFTVLPPSLTVADLTEAQKKSLPANLTLNGTISNLGKSSQIFVVIKAAKSFPTTSTSGTPSPAVQTEDAFNVTLPSSGATTWSFAVNSVSWPPQTNITFTPKVCWDGNVNGNFCYPGQPATLTSNIPEFTAAFLAPTPVDLSVPVNIQATADPLERVNYVRVLITYSHSKDGPIIDKPLTQFITAGANGIFTFSFDSVLLGLKPQSSPQTVSMKLQACSNFSYCGPASAPLSNLVVPATVMNPVTPEQSVNNFIQTNGPGTSITITGTVTGRAPGTVQVQMQYKQDPTKPDSPLLTALASQDIPSYPNTKIGTNLSFTVNLGNVAPGQTVALSYLFCWLGELDFNPQNCASQAIYNVVIPEPKIVNIFLNPDGPYTTPDPAFGSSPSSLIFPVAITNTSTGTVPSFSIPVSVTYQGGNLVRFVNWQVKLTNPTSSKTISTTTNPTGNNTGTSNPSLIPVDTSAVTFANAGNVDIKLIGKLNWVGNGVTIEYPSSAITLTVKLLKLDVNLTEVGFPTSNAVRTLTSNITTPQDKTMYRGLSTFSGTLAAIPSVPVPAALVKRVILRASYSGVEYDLPNANTTEGTNASVNNPDNWSYNWDHTYAPPNVIKATPDDPIKVLIRLCSQTVSDDPQNASCTPVNIAAGLTQKGGLTEIPDMRIVGFRFDDNRGLDGITLTPPDSYLNSTFTTTVRLTNTSYESIGNDPTKPIKALRVFAYVTPSSPQDTTYTTTRMLLGTRAVRIVSPTEVQISYFWDDNLIQKNLTTFTALVSALRANGQKLSIGLQICNILTNSETPAESPNCTDWSGLTMINETTVSSGDVFNTILASQWHSVITGKQAVILTWQPYHPSGYGCPNSTFATDFCPIYDDYLLYSKFTTTPAATLNPNIDVKVYPIDNNLDSLCVNGTPPATAPKITLSFEAPNAVDRSKTEGTIATLPNDTMANTAIGSIGCKYKFEWSLSEVRAIGLRIDPISAPTSRSIQLFAKTTFGNGTIASTYRVATHGVDADYLIADINKAPTIVLNTATTTPESLLITWTTYIAMSSQVKYWQAEVANPVTVTTTKKDSSPSSGTTNHSYNLFLGISTPDQLPPATKFNYVLLSEVGSYIMTSTVQSFTTPPVIINNLSYAVVTTSTITISWNTSPYNTDASINCTGTGGAAPVNVPLFDSGFNKFIHSNTLNGFTHGKNYTCTVISKAANGVTATQTTGSFTP
jgi:hypothetical protein